MHPLLNRSGIAVNMVLAVLFAVAAFVQVNDTDPAIYHRASVIDAWTWLIFYAIVAGMLVFSCFRRVPIVLLILAGGFCLYELVATAPGVMENLKGENFDMTQTSMSAENPEVELSREFFGALLALTSVGYLYWQRFFRRKGVARSTA